MPILLWLLGMPITIILVLMQLGAARVQDLGRTTISCGSGNGPYAKKD
jgi:hypothetical protein